MSPPAPSSGGLKPVPPAVRQRLQQLFEHGKKSFDKGDVDYAHDMFSQCVAEDPGNLIYLQHLRANLARGQAAGKKASRFGGLNMRLKSVHSAIAKASDRGDWQGAFKAGCEALKHHPSDISTLLALADAAGALGATECQLYYLKWALDIDTKHESANRKAAAALTDAGQFEQAIACWRRVLDAKPNDQSVAKAISHLTVEQTIHQGGYDQQLLRKGAGSAAIPDHEASESSSQPAPGVSGEASPPEVPPPESREKQLLDAIRLHPAELDNYVALAAEYTAADRVRDAERVLRKALEVSGGGDLNLREQLEDTQLRRMRQQTAVADRRAESDTTPEARDLAKRMHAQANQVELEVFAARAQREPENVHYQFELGIRLKRAGKYREAIQSLQAARSDASRLAETQLNLGECFQRIEQYRLAMSSYEAAIGAATDPNSDLHKLARYRAGVLATGLEEYDKAEKHLTELAAIDFAYRDVADRLDSLAQMRDT